MIWLVVFSLLIAVVCIVAMFYCIDTTAKALVNVRREHDTCHQHTNAVAQIVASYIGAQILHNAADKFDSVEEQENLKQLAREKFVPDGPSVPAIWMRELAEKMQAGV